MIVSWVVSAVAVLVWVVLAAGRGRFWRTSIRLPRSAAGPSTSPAEWPAVVAVVPARNEADVLPRTVPTLVTQDYPGPWRVVVVDDDSADNTREIAAAAGADVVLGHGPPPGWAGKVAAMDLGVREAGTARFLLFTDADIAYPPDAVRQLVRAALEHDLVLTSQMAKLRCTSFWERVIVPAFVYFFAQLYPFALVNRAGRVAAAAGGCMLVERVALERGGGLEHIRDAVIDDVSLARLLQRQGRIWLGLSNIIESIRPYPHLHDLWSMVARSAYTQLRYSPWLLLGTVIGLLVIYVVPPAALIAGLIGTDLVLIGLGAVGWALMAATFVPMLRFYGVAAWRAVTLPAIAVMYLAMTVDSAAEHRAGRGAAWKGRVRAS